MRGWRALSRPARSGPAPSKAEALRIETARRREPAVARQLHSDHHLTALGSELLGVVNKRAEALADPQGVAGKGGAEKRCINERDEL